MCGASCMIVLSSVVLLTVARLAEECQKYGTDESGEETALGKASIHFGSAHSAVERERDMMDRALGTQASPFHCSAT